MEPQLALRTAAMLLAIAALGGVGMALLRLRGAAHPPAWLALVHGLLAAAALTLLVYAWATVGLPALARAGTAALVAAALGGVWLNLRYHARGLALPVGTMAGHALLAVAGFCLLVLALL